MKKYSYIRLFFVKRIVYDCISLLYLLKYALWQATQNKYCLIAHIVVNNAKAVVSVEKDCEENLHLALLDIDESTYIAITEDLSKQNSWY